MPVSIRIGGAYLEFEGRNAPLMKAVQENNTALRSLTAAYRHQERVAGESARRQATAIQSLSASIRGATGSFNRVGTAAANVQSKIQQLGTTTTAARRSMAALDASSSRAHRSLGSLGTAAESLVRQFTAYERRLAAASRRLTSVTQGTERAATATRRLGRTVSNTREITKGFDRTMIQVVATLVQYRVATIAMTVVSTALGAVLLTSAANFETAFTGILKTVDDATDQFRNLTVTGTALRSGILEIASVTPIATAELAKVAEIAGQLGLEGSQNILEFTQVISRLGVSTDLSAQAAAVGVARLGRVLGFDNHLALGSVLVRLGNTFPAFEGEILSYASRIAGAGRVAGLTADQVLALGAAAASAGVQTEAGGTAIQRLLLTIFRAVSLGGEELEIFSNIAGRTSDEFLASWGEDRGGAILEIFDGIRRGGVNALNSLEELGLGSVRTTRYVLSQAATYRTLEEALSTAADELVEQNALLKESELFFQTFNNEVIQARNNLDNFAIGIGEGLLPTGTSLVRLFNDLSSSGREWTAILGALSLVLLPLSGGFAAAAGGLRLLGATGRFATGFGPLARAVGIGGAAAGGAAGTAFLAEGGIADIFNPYVRVIRENALAQIRSTYAPRLDLIQELSSLGLDAELLRQQRAGIQQPQLSRVRVGADDRIPIAATRAYEQAVADVNRQYAEIDQALARIAQREREITQELRQRDIANQTITDGQNLALRARQATQGLAGASGPQVGFFQDRLEAVSQEEFNLYRQAETRALQLQQQREQAIARIGQQVAAGLITQDQADQLTEAVIVPIETEVNRIHDAVAEVYEGIRGALLPPPEPPPPSLEDLIAAFELQMENLRRANQAEYDTRLFIARQGALAFDREFGGRSHFPPFTSRFSQSTEVVAPQSLSLSRDQALFGIDFDLWQAQNQALEDSIQATSRAVNQLSQAFGNMIEGFLSGTRNAISVLRQLIGQILNLAVQSLLLRPFFETLFSAFPALVPLFAGGGASNQVSIVGGISSVPGFRHGGFHRGGWAVVGEDGPELVNFRRPAQIYSNEDSESLLGGMTINFAPVINSTDEGGVRRALADILPAFESRLENRLIREAGRPSRLSQRRAR